MKKTAAAILVCLALAAFAGCASPKAEQQPPKQTTAIANPWSDWEDLAQAEAAVGFSLGLPDVIADSYRAEVFRTMNGELLEVIYRDSQYEVRVRKQKGEGQDLSGDYNPYDTCTQEFFDGGSITTWRNSDNDMVKQNISCQGYSWSLTAPNGYWGDSNIEFLNQIL